jgi:phosphoribosylanthranilate isomerase
MPVKVKICGVTAIGDALVAVAAGADALGLMFYDKSPRYLTHTAAAKIVEALPPFVAKVGVFVDPSEADVRRAIAECGIDTLQFHGQESPEFCRRFGLKVIKAFRIQSADSLKPLTAYSAEAWLLDSHVPGQLGGTGEKFNWDLAAMAVRQSSRVVLAGGLTPENVAEAARAVQPYAVDVSSGVESSPGKKDAQKVTAFIAAAKSALD